MDRPIDQVLKEIQQKGNVAERDMLIEHYRPFILRTVSHVCKRQIGWDHDESSIGLIAFNEAIDRYNETMGKSFDNFAFMLIRNRLVDEFRRQGRILRAESVVYDDIRDEFEQTATEVASSMEAYEREQTALELAQELLLYDETLQEYGVSLEELESISPKHRDTRKQFIQMAKHFSGHRNWIDILHKTKRLPMKEMLDLFKVSRKTLERNRKYLIALVLIYSNDEFGRIRSTVSFADVGE
ncbi:RNA polymerase sigma-I factor [Paenibacillus bouchesdurhonensis]|uniref:RNA polymerase sigma-I factor n=1 Tax=Paenibacillus bouchesdurhonensis TaxID=1870990 RepID=UPI000DA62424|nr:RNA polymerase sigma-I factor [Paenibacillus bouchesdurhonensis]